MQKLLHWNSGFSMVEGGYLWDITVLKKLVNPPIQSPTSSEYLVTPNTSRGVEIQLHSFSILLQTEIGASDSGFFQDKKPDAEAANGKCIQAGIDATASSVSQILEAHESEGHTRANAEVGHVRCAEDDTKTPRQIHQEDAAIGAGGQVACARPTTARQELTD